MRTILPEFSARCDSFSLERQHGFGASANFVIPANGFVVFTRG